MSESLKDDAERIVADAERFVADGVAAVKAELAKLPHRTLPTYEDVVTAMEAGFRHMMAWRNGPPPPGAPAASDAVAPDVAPADAAQPPADGGS